MLNETIEESKEVKHFREWMVDKGLSPKDLPNTVFELSGTCSLYDEDLSLAQASAILKYVKQCSE